MRKYLYFSCVVMMIGCNLAHSEQKGKSSESVKISLTDSNLISINIELIKTISASVAKVGFISIQDSSRLQSAVEILIKDKIMGLSAFERQKIVKEIIGVDNYSKLETILKKQLGSSEASLRESALVLLGFPLFNLEAADSLKTFLFNKNRNMQLQAIESLVYLDVPGTDNLLCNVLLSDVLPDYLAVNAIEALYLTNNKDLDTIAPILITKDIGGGAFKSLLPVLKKREDYLQIMATMFKQNKMYVPDKQEIALEERVKITAEHSILEEIFEHPESFLSDEDIKKKITMYANSNNPNYNILSIISLLILEKSEQNLEYFTKMLQDNKIPENKKRTLNYIILRIREGKRLK
jgi:hypothetical protein